MEIGILLLLYERISNLDHVLSLIRSLQSHHDAPLYINVDFSGTIYNEEVKNYISNNLTGLQIGELWISDSNVGLKNSVKNSIAKILDVHDAVIVIEDDLLLKKGFFEFMIKSLNFYSSNRNVFTISGYSPFIHPVNETIFSRRLGTWGWATWKDRYQEYLNFEESLKIQKNLSFSNFMKLRKGGSDIFRLRKLNKSNKISSWAIEFCSFQLIHDLATVYPPISYVKNIGVDQFATHSKYHLTNLGNNTPILLKEINFNTKIKYSRELIRPYSLISRIKNRIVSFNQKSKL